METVYLVPTPQAIEAINAHRSETSLKAAFGSPDKFPSMGERISELHRTVATNATRVIDLAKDQTRTEVVRHVAAKELATRTAQAIRTVAAEVVSKAEYLQRHGQEVADQTLGPRSGYEWHDMELRNWLRENSRTPEGMGKISELAKSDFDVAAVIYHSKHFLTGLSESLHTRMRLAAVERFVPKAYAALNEGIDLAKLAPRYERTVQQIHSTWYNEGLAAKGATRVELGD